MNLIYHPSFLEHQTGSHPENAERLRVFLPLNTFDFDSGETFLGLVHTSEYVREVQGIAENDPGWIDGDTFVSAGSYRAACMAAGAAIYAASTNGLALVRPPGHHAYPGRGTGFCIFNNVAIAVKHLLKSGHKRVLIFDFDGHYGDGTSDIFYDTPEVLFWSIHQYPAFPGKGYLDEIGAGRGTGYTLNVPVPPESGDDIYEHAINTFFPLAEQFNPDIVAYSAGFDAHHSDPLLNLRITNSLFYEIGRKFGQRFSSHFAVLEGGYNLQYLKGSVFSFIQGIIGEEPGYPEHSTTSHKPVWDEYLHRVQQLKPLIRDHWNFD